MRNKNMVKWGVVLCMGIIFVSCKTRRLVSQTPVSPNTNLKLITDRNEFLAKVLALSPTYENLNIRFSSDIRIDKNENSVRGKLKIRRDSCIWASVLPLGLEAARVLITQEEVGVVNFLKRNYYRGEYTFLAAQIGYEVTYPMLQAALTGTPVYVEPQEDYRLEYDTKASLYHFSPYTAASFKKYAEGAELTNKKMVQSLWFSPTDYTLAKSCIYDAVQRRYMEITYGTYQKSGNDLLPTTVHIIIKSGKTTSEITLTYNRTDVNENGMEYPFTVPASYSKM